MPANGGSNHVSFKLIKALGGRKVGPGIIERTEEEKEQVEKPVEPVGRVPRGEIDTLVKQALDERREIDSAVRQALDDAMTQEVPVKGEEPAIQALVREAVEEALTRQRNDLMQDRRESEEGSLRRIEDMLRNCKMQSGSYVDFSGVFEGIANVIRKEMGSQGQAHLAEDNSRPNGIKQAISDAIERRTEAYLTSMRQKIEQESVRHVDELLGEFMPMDTLNAARKERKSAVTGGDFQPGNTPVQAAVDVSELSKSIAEAVRSQIGDVRPPAAENLEELDKRMGRLMEAVEKAELLATRISEYGPARRYRRGSPEHFLDKQRLGILEEIFKNNIQLQTTGTEVSVDETAVQPAEAVPQTEGALQ